MDTAVVALLTWACILSLSAGAPLADEPSDVFDMQPARRELNQQDNCEDILCAPLPSTCTVSATREPSQLVGKDGQPCPVCPVCLDYVADLPVSG